MDYEAPKRVIPCFDVTDGRVVKGVQFQDLRDAGDPASLAQTYEAGGADELVFLDISATNEARSTVVDTVRRVAREVFIPFTVGGGIRSVADAQAILDNGADRVAVNSAALREPSLLSDLAEHIGKQSTVLSIDAKRIEGATSWEAYGSGGTQPSGRDAIAWAVEGARLGAGEILLTSIDRDGKNSGYDLDLLHKVAEVVNIPVIASGGAGTISHFSEAIQRGLADAVLCASTLHDGILSIAQIKNHLDAQGIPVRPLDSRIIQPIVGDEAGQRPSVAIVDYGMGNRASVAAAIKFAGAEVFITGDAEEIMAADGVVLPGVGAFPAAMQQLRERGLIEPLQLRRDANLPILGICLGHQLLFAGSEEQIETEGLGWINGQVTEIDTAVSPNIGWRLVDFQRESPLTAGFGLEELFYHVHSLAAQPEDPEAILGIARLGQTSDQQLSQATSIVESKSVYGTQFHPEKSSYSGLRLLANYIELCRIDARRRQSSTQF